MLIGGLSAGALTSCGPQQRVTTDDVFTNNHYVPGVGYYHAPFHAWYTHPYNHYDPQTARYFQGGQWLPAPHESIVNISSPSVEAAQRVAQQYAVQRRGFGSSSGTRWISS